MNKKIIIALVLGVIIAGSVAAVIVNKNNAPENIASENIKTEDNEAVQEDPSSTAAEKAEATKNEENINGLDKPIFMYFVTNKDLEDKITKETLSDLQEEYKDRVIFEIRNADEDKTLYDNFPIEGAMPMLIMQKKGGDISNFLFKTNDYQSLKAAIDATL